MLLGSLAEVFSVALVVPFLASLSSPDSLIEQNKLLESAFLLFNISSHGDKTALLGAFFIIAIVLSSLIRMYVIWINAITSANIGHEISQQAFSNVLRRSFSKHKQSNTSNVVSGLINHLHNTVLVINSLLLGAASILIVLSISIGLLMIDITSTLVFYWYLQQYILLLLI